MKSLELLQRSFKSNSHSKGFTLIEVMVSLAILGILASLAAPSFSESIKRYRVNAIKDDLIASMQAARSEAIRRGTPVILLRLTGCGAEAGDSDSWSCGWQTVVDADSNGSASATEIAAALQVTTVPAGYDVMHTGLGAQVIFNRWGQAGVGQIFVATQTNDGVAGKATITLCMSSGGRTRSVKGEATCS
jgi:type IV fimbrial biogenesis protein FimT